MSFNLRKGLRYEARARDYLLAHGLRLLEANFRCRFGEIDLIMEHADCVCFVEVRYRESLDYGGASASITRVKQRRIVKAALFYLSRHTRLAQRALRFDALLLQREADDRLGFDWIQNAFYAE
jgi:putative endonuclease